jgi:hypothetical protein
VRWEKSVRNGNGPGAPVGRTADDGHGGVGLAQDRRYDDGVATGGTDDPAAWFNVTCIFFVRGGVGEGVELVIGDLGIGKRKDEFRSVIVPLGKRSL